MNRKRWALGLITAAALAADLPDQALANPLAPEVVDQIDIVQEVVEDGTLPPQRNPVTPSEEGARIARARAAAARASGTAASRLRSQAWKLAARLRLLPLVPNLPPVQLAAETFAVGFSIGTALRPMIYVELPMVPASTPEIKWGSWRAQDDVLLTAGSAAIRAPEYGLLGMGANQQTVSWQEWSYDCIAAPNAIPPNTEGFDVLSATRPCQWPGTPGTMTHFVAFFPVMVSLPVPYTDQDVRGHVEWPDYDALHTDTSVDATRIKLLNELQQNGADYQDLIDWLNYEFGVNGAPDPIAGGFNMPDCFGLTVAACNELLPADSSAVAQSGSEPNDPIVEQADAPGKHLPEGADPQVETHAVASVPACQAMTASDCVTALRNAGFTGPVRNSVLSAADADPGGLAGRVTATYPSPGESIRTDIELEVVLNPDPLPQSSTAEAELADTLQANNPDSVTSAIKTRLARACRKYATSSQCSGMPVFFTGDDAREAADHDASALASNPTWLVLNRRTVGSNSRWYRNKPRCLTVAQPTDRTTECDEYPFWSTMQGKGGALETATPSISWIDKKHNGLQGRALRKFYSADAAGVYPRGCSIRADDPTDRFLAIPIPRGVPQATTYACNRG